jgi:hypothetical protein
MEYFAETTDLPKEKVKENPQMEDQKIQWPKEK